MPLTSSRALSSLLFVLLIASPTSDTEDEAWKAAMALKQRADNVAAAAAFTKFRADFPQSSQAIASSIEAGVCWFSAGRAALVLQRTTPEARQHFDKAQALFESVTRDHATSPEAARACYMQGSTHLFQDQLEAADLDYTRVIESFSADRNYFAKALDQRADVRRHMLNNQAAILDLRRWVKEVGSPPEQLSKVNAQLARALLLDKPAPRYSAVRWYNSDPLPLEGQVGMVVGLYFFATWCTNCEAELPFMLDLERRLIPRGVRLIGVVDQAKGQSAEVVQQFLNAKGIQFAVLQDNGATSANYKAGTIPMLALIDRLGTLRWLDNPSTLLESTIDLVVDGMPEPSKSSGEK